MDIALELIDSGHAVAGMERLVLHLNDTRKAMSDSAWRLFAKWALTHPIVRYVHADPCTHRAFTKPRGYAGDAVMMDYIYGLEALPRGAASSPVTHYTTVTGAAALAVRYRRQRLADTLDTLVASKGRAITVTTVGCGHARELALSASAQQGLVSVTAIDQDEACLDLVTREYGSLGVTPRLGSARGILSGKCRLPVSDLVYAAGPYDYLTQPAAGRLTHWLFDAVAPRGTLLLANFLPTIPDIGYMESFMDWHLIYRDDLQMRALADLLPPHDVASIRQFHDPLDAITFLEVTRR